MAAERYGTGRSRPPATKESDITKDSDGNSIRLKQLVIESLEDDKAEDPTVIGLAGKTTIADFMIIASGRSSRHVAAIAEHLEAKLKKSGVPKVGVEGKSHADWVLLDAGDVIVHVFRPEVRAFYNLEKMWAVPIPEQAVG